MSLVLKAYQSEHRRLSDEIAACHRALLIAMQQKSEDAKEALNSQIASLLAQQASIEADMTEELRFTQEIADKLSDKAATYKAAHTDRGLVRPRHPNRDFFLADLFDYALKDDGASMEAPIFTLSTKPDLSLWEWRSRDGNKHVKVTPSVLGRATQYDKDILIFVVSQLTEGLNRGREDAQNRTVRFTVHDFMITANRSIGGRGYEMLKQAFERLAGTRITTDIKTGGQRVRQGFGVIDEWRIVEKSPLDERMIAVEVTLSRWLFNAVQAFEVLTIHPDYFRLRSPLARRLYELARKHCGYQAQWAIGLPLLQEKAGSKSTLKEFRRAIRTIKADDSLPEYRLSLGFDDKVTFYTRDLKRLAQNLAVLLP
jgi:hypothetical protein